MSDSSIRGQNESDIQTDPKKDASQGEDDYSRPKRRFPRIFLGKVSSGLSSLTGAEAKWKNGMVSGVWDISLNGAALLRPSSSLEKCEKGDLVDIAMHIQDESPFDMTVEVVRSNEKIIAVLFKEMGPEGRLIMDRYLNSKMIGLNMRLVDPKNYAQGLEISFWFHGPKDANLYLWIQKEKISRFIIELNYSVIEYAAGKVEYRSSSSELEKYTDLYSLPALVQNPAPADDEQLKVIENAIDVVSYVPTHREVLDQVTDILKRNFAKAL